MTTPPPLAAPVGPAATSQTAAINAEHLRLLVIFHYVIAGLKGLGLLLVMLHGTLMFTVFRFGIPELRKQQAANAPPIEFFLAFFGIVYGIFGIFLVTGLILNLLAAQALRARRRRTLCLIAAAMNCFGIPFGTILGIFTFIVLQRPAVAALFDQNPANTVQSR